MRVKFLAHRKQKTKKNEVVVAGFELELLKLSAIARP